MNKFQKIQSWCLGFPFVWNTVNSLLADTDKKYDHHVSKDLASDGFSISSLDQIFSGQADRILAEIKNLYPSNRLLAGLKPHLKYWVGEESHRHDFVLCSSNPLIKLAESNEIKSIVKSYIGHRCELKHVEFSRTSPIESSEQVFSQNWHRDPGIVSCVKVFLYVSDVRNDNGPFSYCNSTHKRGRNRGFCENNKWYGGGYYPSVEQLGDMQAANVRETSIEGDKGSLIFADTTGVHMGGRCIRGYRDMVTFVYYPILEPVRCRVKVSSASKSYKVRF